MPVDKMDEFFDSVSGNYDEHMKQTVHQFNRYYERISEEIVPTDKEIKILDLGIGTGLELAGIFKRAPNALIDAVDISEKMLGELLKKFSDKSSRINLHRASYLAYEAPENHYDYVVAVMTLHHLTADLKLNLYERISGFLKDGGLFVEGDYYVAPLKEKQLLNHYHSTVSGVPGYKHGDYHIDIPFSLRTQKELLNKSGFDKIKVVYKKSETGIITASKSKSLS